VLFDVEMVIWVEFKIPPAEDLESLDRKSICEKAAEGKT
jgi:hypothetical protein